jgi:histidinol dehydrogenase
MPGGAAQDLPAGPSEVLVIADASADPQAVCLDLLAQSEHGPDSQALLFSDSFDLLRAVTRKLPGLAEGLPRAGILQQSLRALRLVQVDGIAEAIAASNDYAPEHLILNCSDPGRYVDAIQAAGSVFLGPLTPETLGDYCSGTNHVLPTYGYARAYSGLSVSDFMRRMTVQCADREGLENTGPDAMTLAAAEGLEAHRKAVAWRLGEGG